TFGAQMVRQRKREVARHDGARDSKRPARVRDERLVDLLAVQARLDQLVPADLLERVDVDALELADAGHFERADVDVSTAAALGVEERVRDADRDFVTELGRANG